MWGKIVKLRNGLKSPQSELMMMIFHSQMTTSAETTTFLDETKLFPPESTKVPQSRENVTMDDTRATSLSELTERPVVASWRNQPVLIGCWKYCEISMDSVTPKVYRLQGGYGVEHCQFEAGGRFQVDV